MYYLAWSIALVAFAVAWLILRGRTGRAFRAVRDSETAAVSSGVSLARYKTLAFGISAAYAGVAGGLFVIASAFVNPDTFPVALSIFLLVGIVVGGLGGLSGLVFGAIFVAFLPLWAQGQDLGSLLPDRIVEETQKPGGPSIVYGVVLILLMFVLPNGVGGLFRRIGQLLREPPLLSLEVMRLRSSLRRRGAHSSVAAPVALAGSTADPGVSSTTIVIGGTSPLTGPAASYASVARGAKAYFDSINAQGGVAKRKIEYRIVDDAYNPAQTVQAVRRLVEQDKVFAVFNTLGTEANLAVRDYLNQVEGAPALRRLGRDDVGARRGEVPVDDRLPAELRGGGLRVRPVRRADHEEGEDRRALPERRLRQGPARRR